MANRVFINSEGFVEVTVDGDQTGQTFRQSSNDAQPFIHQLRKQKKPVLGLIDLSHKGKYTPESNKAAMQLLEDMDYDRIAMYGAEYVLKEVTELIILAMGRKDTTKLFGKREDAVAWLQTASHPAGQVASGEYRHPSETTSEV